MQPLTSADGAMRLSPSSEKPSINSKALIVASGMRGVGGHNFSYTRAVQQALEDRGLAVTVFANRNLAPELERTYAFRPVFSHGTYDLPPGNGPWRDLLYLYLQSGIYAEELHRGLANESGDFALIFC